MMIISKIILNITEIKQNQEDSRGTSKNVEEYERYENRNKLKIT